MKLRNLDNDEENCIKQDAKSPVEYDEVSILDELREAERDWEALKKTNPVKARQIEGSNAPEFDKLMKRIREAD